MLIAVTPGGTAGRFQLAWRKAEVGANVGLSVQYDQPPWLFLVQATKRAASADW